MYYPVTVNEILLRVRYNSRKCVIYDFGKSSFHTMQYMKLQKAYFLSRGYNSCVEKTQKLHSAVTNYWHPHWSTISSVVTSVDARQLLDSEWSFVLFRGVLRQTRCISRRCRPTYSGFSSCTLRIIASPHQSRSPNIIREGRSSCTGRAAERRLSEQAAEQSVGTARLCGSGQRLLRVY